MIWTVSSIAARRATGDVLVTRGGWSVSFDTSSETGKVARLSCIRYAPRALIVEERDVRDGDTFATADDAECYALNAGRLWWFSEYKAQKAALAAEVSL